MPSFVLDTNTVLDAWWFEDLACRLLVRTLVATPRAWCHTTGMRDELMDVLHRRPFAGQPDRCQRTRQAIDSLSMHLETAPPPAPWRCRDPDDQPFLDLALQLRPCWLLTRDRALLELGGRAASSEVLVVSPTQWASRAAAALGHPGVSTPR